MSLAQAWPIIAQLWAPGPDDAPPNVKVPVVPERAEAITAALAEIRARFDRQASTLATLDTKAAQVLGAASIVTGLAGLATTGSASSGVVGLLAAAAVSYAAAALASIRAAWPRKQGVGSRPSSALELASGYSAAATEWSIAHRLAADIDHNRKLADFKADLVRIAQVALALETALLAVAILVARTS
ncbi:MAG: hypothetical protein R3C15_15575 [Thermoleophilia bacterium]